MPFATEVRPLGFGCMTCIGNSGPLTREMNKASGL